LKDYPKAIGYLRQYVLMQERGLPDEGLAYAYFDMGVAFAGLNQLDSANLYEQKALATFGKYQYEEPLVYQVLGDIKMQTGQQEQALAYYQRSLVTALRKMNPASHMHLIKSSLYKKINKPDSAIYYAKISAESN
jgi:tetratricopeptide (TPR) repeat protein